MAAIEGDWEVTDGSEFGIVNKFELPLRRYVKSTLPDGDAAIVAKVWSDGEDYESTARLVASAPALLSALRAAADFIDGHNDGIDMNDDKDWLERCFRLQRLCNNALASAEGRTE